MEKDAPAFGEASLKWVRAYRYSSLLELSPALQEKIKASVLAKIGLPLNPEATSLAASMPPKLTSSADYDQQIRSLLPQNPTWGELGPLLAKRYHLSPSPEMAAYLIELSFLYGGLAETHKELDKLLAQQQEGFYPHIHPTIRGQILLSLWQEKRDHGLFSLLVKQQADSKLLPLERFFIYYGLCQQEEHALGFLFFQQYQSDIIAAIKDQSLAFPFSTATIHLWAARQAWQLGRNGEAARLLQTILPQDEEYKEAVRLLHSLPSEHSLFQKHRYSQKIEKAGSWEEKLALLSTFLSEVAGRPEARHHDDLTALNCLLADPFQWLPAKGSCIEALSRTLLAYASCANQLANYYAVFFTHALNRHSFELECALWRPLAQLLPGEGFNPLLLYFQGVGKLHLFLAEATPRPDEELFAARHCIRQAYSQAGEKPKGLRPWKHFWQWACQQVESNHELLPTPKQSYLKLLQAATEPELFVVKDVEAYLLSPQSQPPPAALQEYQEFAWQKKAEELEISLILKANQAYSHYVNQDLERLWYLCVKRQKHDLGWRTLTILGNRMPLPEALAQAWRASGEQKTLYPFLTPKITELDCCLHGFSPEAARLAWACLKVGGAIPQLFGLYHSHIHLFKPTPPKKKAADWQRRIEQTLADIKWLSPGAKNYALDESSTQQGFAMPAFAEILPTNPWSHLAALIAHRMSMPAWKWRLSVFLQQVKASKQAPQPSWQPFQRENDGLSAWKKALSSEQRSAWHDLSQIAQKLDDTEAFCILACFVCRLATLIHPHHDQALKSLVAMRAPVFLIWDLENWLLSPSYGQLRQRSGYDSKVPIPPSLQEEPLLGEALR